MDVTRFEIISARYDADTTRHQAHVCLDMLASHGGAPVHAHFLCHSRCGPDSPASLVTQDLIRDALRQARRMPGFRRGERRIVLRLPA